VVVDRQLSPASHPRATIALAAAAAYLAAHLPFLAPSLEDIDSINFALGLRAFNPALHQPHPPGHPVYMALGHVSLAVVERVTSMSSVAAEAWSLAIWSALGGAAAIVAAWFLFVALAQRSKPLQGESGVAAWATLLLAVSPLFWMSGSRPMSDMPGLAMALGAQALLLMPRARPARLMQGALLAGVAVGLRVQDAALTLPLLVLAIVEARDARRAWRACAVFTAACLGWGIPLVIASGGVNAYLAALHSQAGEDFAWVTMLWADPTPRHAALALYQTLVLPWASMPLAVCLAVPAVAGACVMALRERRAFVALVLATAPYAVFHLLFQQTDTTRYALPVLPAIAWLAARGLATMGRFTRFVAVPVIAFSLIVACPPAVAYGREAHPAFRAIRDAVERARSEAPGAVYSHYSVRRPLQAADTESLHVVDPPTRFEWLGLVDYWRHGGTAPVWFLADARRTDLALIDPRSRLDVVRYRWSVADRPELGGTRPVGVDWYRLSVPGWFAGQGWSLTPETGGITEVTAMGPDHRPIEAWVRRRPGPFHLFVGGRHLGVDGDADAEFDLTVDGMPVDRWRLSVAERNFLRLIDLPQGVGGTGPFAALTIASHSLTPSGRAATAIRQFDIQPVSNVIVGFGEGWHEDEFTIDTGLRWRWTSERSVLRIAGPPQAVRITLRGESPLKYLDAAPNVRITAGDAVLARFRPDTDFMWNVTVPADALARSDGSVAVESDRVYLPGPAEGTSDARHLGLRIFDVRVVPAPR